MKEATEEFMTLAARLHRREPGVLAAFKEQLGDGRSPAAIEGMAWAFRDWFSHGLTLTVFQTVGDAVALAETDPPAWHER